MSKSVIVIGAGIGGLAAALRLAQAGCDVTVLEAKPRVGGFLSEYRAGGFSWTIGPPAVYAWRQLEALFDALGRNLDDCLRPLPLDPQLRFFYPDGSVFNIHRDWTATAEAIARIEPADVSGYLRFLAFAARQHERRRYGFGSSESPPAMRLRSWLRAAPFRSAHSAIRRFARSEKLARALAHCLSLSGGNIYAMPATACELAHGILSDGLWRPRDGIRAIPEALAQLATESDIDIRLNCGAQRIEIERKRAVGVTLAANGDFLPADAVISNCDPISTARDLLPAEALSPVELRRLARRPLSSSAFIMLLGIRGSFPLLARHNIFLPADERLESERIFSRGLMPEEPAIWLNVTCKTDPRDAPVNQENWLIQLQAPPLSERIRWETESAALRERVLNILERRLAVDLRERIRVEKLLTPADLANISGAWRGALHGELPQGPRAALSKPRIRSRYAQGLYQVGNAVVAGGGMPQALLSAEAAAELLLRDLE